MIVMKLLAPSVSYSGSSLSDHVHYDELRML
jgi:hypothetical protein